MIGKFVPAKTAVRAIWADSESLDLSRLYHRVEAVEGHADRVSIDPSILLSLWL